LSEASSVADATAPDFSVVRSAVSDIERAVLCSSPDAVAQRRQRAPDGLIERLDVGLDRLLAALLALLLGALLVGEAVGGLHVLLEHRDGARHLADLVGALDAGDLDGEVVLGEAAHRRRDHAERLGDAPLDDGEPAERQGERGKQQDGVEDEAAQRLASLRVGIGDERVEGAGGDLAEKLGSPAGCGSGSRPPSSHISGRRRASWRWPRARRRSAGEVRGGAGDGVGDAARRTRPAAASMTTDQALSMRPRSSA